MSHKICKVAIRLLIPAATLIAEKTELKCKPSELPIYTPETAREPMKIVREPGTLEQQVGHVRKQIVSLTSQVTEWQNYAVDMYEDSKGQAQGLINYLREEDNTTPKAGAIAIGGLAGFILGLRGGFFRRLLFTSAGALGMAAVCYPKEAADYSDVILVETKRYIKIAYNFYHGNTDELQHLLQEVTPTKDIIDEVIPIEQDPQTVVSHLHEKATKKNCHCPIGACLHSDDEGPPS